jgi:hypothetical protein
MTFQKVEETKEENTSKSMYTYGVNMIVSVFSEDEESARKALDQNGGFVSYRVVDLKDVVSIYTPEEKE